nr:hypothetical protein [Rothia nasimurium]
MKLAPKVAATLSAAALAFSMASTPASAADTTDAGSGTIINTCLLYTSDAADE